MYYLCIKNVKSDEGPDGITAEEKITEFEESIGQRPDPMERALRNLRALQDSQGISYEEGEGLPPEFAAGLDFGKQFVEAGINIEYD